MISIFVFAFQTKTKKKETRKSVRDNLIRRGWTQEECYTQVGKDGKTAAEAIREAASFVYFNHLCYHFNFYTFLF